MKKTFKTQENQIKSKIKNVIKNTKNEVKQACTLASLSKALEIQGKKLAPLKNKLNKISEKNFSENKIFKSLFNA